MSDPARAAARLWQARAHAELVAAGRFRRIAAELATHDADSAVIGLAQRAAVDERRHFDLCSQLVVHFGAEPTPMPPIATDPLRSGAPSSRAQILYEVVAMSCVTESLSTALLMAIRDQAAGEQVREVVHEVLRDEVRHAQLGWAHLAGEARQVDLSFIGPQLPAMLANTVSQDLFEAEDSPDDATVVGLGGLSRRDRKQIFLGTMLEVVLPGLRRFGVDTRQGANWLDAPWERPHVSGRSRRN